MLGPFTIQHHAFATSPVFARNAWFGGSAGKPSITRLYPCRGDTPLRLSQTQHCAFPLQSTGSSLQVLCCPQVPTVRAGPAFVQSCLVPTARHPAWQIFGLRGRGVRMHTSSPLLPPGPLACFLGRLEAIEHLAPGPHVEAMDVAIEPEPSQCKRGRDCICFLCPTCVTNWSWVLFPQGRDIHDRK